MTDWRTALATQVLGDFVPFFFFFFFFFLAAVSIWRSPRHRALGSFEQLISVVALFFGFVVLVLPDMQAIDVSTY
jgi:hypothetical protein